MLEPMIDFNRWVEANDTASLLRLRTRAEGNPMLTGYNALASAYLAEMEMERGISDSLAVRLNDMEAGLGEPYQWRAYRRGHQDARQNL